MASKLTRVTLGTGNPVITPPTLRFPGDPGDGNFYMGITPTHSSIATHESEMGAPLAMVRLFFGSDTISSTSIGNVISGGRIPWIRFGPGARTNASIASGSQSAWIAGLAAQINAFAPWPVWVTYEHEPENDAGLATPYTATVLQNLLDYRNAERQVYLGLRAGASNVANAVVCYQTPFTWPGGTSGRDWRQYYPDWKNTTGVGSATSPDPNDFYIGNDPLSCVDMIGHDIYHLWGLKDQMVKWNSITAPSTYNTRFGTRTEFLQKPYAIGEWSTMAAQDGFTFNADGSLTVAQYNTQVAAGGITFYPDTTRLWIDDYFTFQRQHGCVAMCYWDDQTDGDVANGHNPLAECDPAKTRWIKLGEIGRTINAAQWSG